MNKQQLVTKISDSTKMPKAQIETVIDCLTATVKTSVKQGHDVKLIGFGTFMKSKRKARTIRNPQTGQPIKVPAMWTPKFRAGSEFKTLIK